MVERPAPSWLEFGKDKELAQKRYRELSSLNALYSDSLKLDIEEFKDPVPILKNIQSDFQQYIEDHNKFRKDNDAYLEVEKVFLPTDSTVEAFPGFYFDLSLLVAGLGPRINDSKLISKISELVNQNLSLAEKSIWALPGMNKSFYIHLAESYNKVLEMSRNSILDINVSVIKNILNYINELAQTAGEIERIKSSDSEKKAKDFESSLDKVKATLPEALRFYEIPDEFLEYSKETMDGRNYSLSSFDSAGVRAQAVNYYNVLLHFPGTDRTQIDTKSVDLCLSESYQYLDSPKNLELLKSITLLNLHMFKDYASKESKFLEVTLDDEHKLPFKVESYPRLILEIIDYFPNYTVLYRGKKYKGAQALKVLNYANKKDEVVELVITPEDFYNIDIPEKDLEKALILLESAKK